jgi:hypothetical protein
MILTPQARRKRKRLKNTTEKRKKSRHSILKVSYNIN